MQRITTFLTFEAHGKQAVDFYLATFKESKLHSVMMLPGGDTLLHAAFSLDGHEFMAMDGGPHFTFAQGTSLFVACKDQQEVDYYWEALTADGGQPGQCGWLTDKFGVSWQVVPDALGQLMQSQEPGAGQRVMQAMLQMGKIDVAALQAAHDQK